MHWHGLKGILIFDSNPNHARDYPTKSKLNQLEVAHAPYGVEGDLYILEYIRTVQNKNVARLITSDRELSRRAKELKIETIDSTDFLSLLMDLSSKKSSKLIEAKPTKESKRELERLEKIFEDLL